MSNVTTFLITTSVICLFTYKCILCFTISSLIKDRVCSKFIVTIFVILVSVVGLVIVILVLSVLVIHKAMTIATNTITIPYSRWNMVGNRLEIFLWNSTMALIKLFWSTASVDNAVVWIKVVFYFGLVPEDFPVDAVFIILEFSVDIVFAITAWLSSNATSLQHFTLNSRNKHWLNSRSKSLGRSSILLIVNYHCPSLLME